MKLICNVDYRVWVADRMTEAPWNQKVVQLIMTYCGGSYVDKDGHWAGGGAWCMGDHPNSRTYWGLRILSIEEVGPTFIKERLP